MTTKASLHALVERLPEDALPEAERVLATLTGDLFYQAMLNAPLDDEPLTEEDLVAIEEAREAKKRGELIPWEHVRDELLSGDECPGD